MKKVLFIFSCLILLLVMGCSTPTASETTPEQSPITETTRNDGVIEVKAATFADLEGYTFEADKTYCIHVNKEIMSLTSNSFENELNTFISKNSSITEVIVDKDVTKITNYAFYSCRNLTSITLSEGLISISGSSIFSDCAITSINIPATVKEIGYNAVGGWIPSNPFSCCKKLTEITVAEGNEIFSAEDGVLFDKDQKTLIAYPAGKTGDNYTIPDTVTEIGKSAFLSCSFKSIDIPENVKIIESNAFQGNHTLEEVTIHGAETIKNDAFSDCENLTTITLPESLTSIEFNAFMGSGIKKINIPASVTEIGNYAFSYCTNLTEITVADGNKNFSAKDGVLFDKEQKKLIAYSAGKTGDNYTIPDTVTEIGYHAFHKCNLTSITIPANIKIIGEGAFYGCDTLATINYPGTEEEWNSIEGKDKAKIPNGCNITCTDGNITYQAPTN